jgi:hypothetical protein
MVQDDTQDTLDTAAAIHIHDESTEPAEETALAIPRARCGGFEG